MANVGNWVLQNTTTLGTGPITLGITDVGQASFQEAIPVGTVWYAIQDGGNREAGIGTFDGNATLVRTTVMATLKNGAYNDVNPTPIDLSGSASVGCTFNKFAFDSIFAHILNTSNPHNVAAIQIPYDPAEDPVSVLTNVQDVLVDHGHSIEERTPAMTGVIEGGELSGSGTTFSVTAGRGAIYDSTTDPSNTKVTPFTWTAKTNVTLDIDALAAGSTRIFITQANSVLQVPGHATADLFRDYVFLGAVSFIGGQIIDVINAPAVINQTATSSYDAMTQDIEFSGSDINPVDALLKIWIGSGSVFYPGVNWLVNRKAPNTADMAAIGSWTVGAQFYPMSQFGTLDLLTDVVPEAYNPFGDALVDLTGNNATIHRLFSVGVSASRGIILLFGQHSYNNANTARDNVDIDDNITVFPAGLSADNFLGHVCVSHGAADFTDPSKAWIINDAGSASSTGAAIVSHTALTNRDALDQHPQSAITDLVADLALKAAITYVDSQDTILAGDISANAADILTNANAIAANALDIAANTAAILANDGDIATNAADIVTNANAIAANAAAILTKEPGLGNPLVDGYVLSSTVAGLRSWVEPASVNPDILTTAWCTASGTLTGTNAPIDGHNIASILRNSTGSYAVAFTTAMDNANYCVELSIKRRSADGSSAGTATVAKGVAPTTTGFTMVTSNQTGNSSDVDLIFINIKGGKA